MLTSNMDDVVLAQLSTVKDLGFQVIINTYIDWRIYNAIQQINQPI